MTYNNARRVRDYSPPMSEDVAKASEVICDFVKDHQGFIIVEKWHELFEEFDTMPEIAEYLKGDPCPCCLGDNIRTHVLIDHVTCGDCGHTY